MNLIDLLNDFYEFFFFLMFRYSGNSLQGGKKESKVKNKCTEKVFLLDNRKLCFAIGKWNFNLERLYLVHNSKVTVLKQTLYLKIQFASNLGQSLEGTYSI